MRKVNVLEFVSLDGVIQAPGGPEEDTSGGFEYGGWISPHSDAVSNRPGTTSHLWRDRVIPFWQDAFLPDGEL